MTLRQLEMLLAVLEFGSYARAAEQLNISHSAVHRQIRLLEWEVHERILVRAGKRVDLTEAGEILRELGMHIRETMSQSLLRIRDLGGMQHGCYVELHITSIL